MSDEDPVCRICGERKSAHIATDAGPFTHPREARGEGIYRLVSRGTLGGGLSLYDGALLDDQPYEHWEFVPTTAADPRAPGPENPEDRTPAVAR